MKYSEAFLQIPGHPPEARRVAAAGWEQRPPTFPAGRKPLLDTTSVARLFQMGGKTAEKRERKRKIKVAKTGKSLKTGLIFLLLIKCLV